MEKEIQLDKLDYSIQDIQARNELVRKICQQHEDAKIPISKHYLDVMADYCLNLDVKKEYKDQTILTKNRMSTVYKRETSYEGLQEILPGGESDIYNMTADNPGNIKLVNKEVISEEDVEEIPELQSLREEIEKVKKNIETASGKRLFILKKTLISLQEEQYIIRSLKKESNLGILATPHKIKTQVSYDLFGTLVLDENGEVKSTDLVDLSNEEHVKYVMKDYEYLKHASRNHFYTDLFSLVERFDDVMENYVKNEKFSWYLIFTQKTIGMHNDEIAEFLKSEHGIEIAQTTISTIWCNSLPKLIAEEMKRRNTISYYSNNHLPFKTCKHCHKELPVNKLFFHKNKQTSDGYYAICKECRKGGK